MKQLHLDHGLKNIIEKARSLDNIYRETTGIGPRIYPTYGNKWITDINLIRSTIEWQQELNQITKIYPKLALNNEMYNYWGITIRNNIWLDIILENFEKEPCFVCCGYAHISGLVELLKQNGYNFTFIQQN